MHKNALRAGVAAVALLATHAVQAQHVFPATLAGHAVLSAQSFFEAPADASGDLRIAGKYTTGKRVAAVGTIMGRSGERPTGVALPFNGQPVQGHSGIKVMADGTFWILTDNGFGAKANSPDSMLFLNRYRIDWNSGAWSRLETIFLSDPDRKVPFRILEEATSKRFLTGSDFDIEGFQWIGETLWIGDEFGPYLIKADKSGRVQAVFDTVAEGKPVRSPENWAVTSPAAPDQTGAFNLRRSKGFEGFASSKDGRFLYALLEGPLWDAEEKVWEKTGAGKEFARILEFDVAGEKWTGRSWRYAFETTRTASGAFNMIDGTTGLVIERDNGEGTAEKACAAGARGPDCFADIARFKRVYKIEMTDANVGREVRKIGFIDLMNIQDPNKKARKPLNNGVLTFPFVTIENVDIVDPAHIVVGNDNNLPFSAGRETNKADDNELVLLEVGEFLRAR